MNHDPCWEDLRDMPVANDYDKSVKIHALKKYIENRPDTKQRRRAERLLKTLER